MGHGILFQIKFFLKMSPTLHGWATNKFWVLAALKTADWPSKIGDK